MARVTFRFGRVWSDEGTASLPSLSELEAEIGERGIIGQEGNRRGVRNVVLEDEFLSVDFIKEVEDEYTRLDSNNEDETEKAYPRRVMRLLLLDNYYYTFESRQRVSDIEALQFLFSPFDMDPNYTRIDDLSLDVMRHFYKSHPRIKKVKTKNIGEREPNPHPGPDRIEEIVDEAGEVVANSEFSVGRTDRNLKQSELVDEGFANRSDLPRIKAVDSGGEIRVLTESGRLRFSYPHETEDGEEISEEEQSRSIKNTAIDALQNLFGRGENDFEEDSNSDEE